MFLHKLNKEISPFTVPHGDVSSHRYDFPLPLAVCTRVVGTPLVVLVVTLAVQVTRLLDQCPLHTIIMGILEADRTSTGETLAAPHVNLWSMQYSIRDVLYMVYGMHLM